MEHTRTQMESWPVTRNCEAVSCKYCEAEIVVLQKHLVLTYTCPMCFNAETESKKLGSIV